MEAYEDARDHRSSSYLESPVSAGKGEYFPISLGIMQPGTLSPTDLFVCNGSYGYTLYRAAHTEFHERTRRRLLDRGFENLFLRKSDENAYRSYVEENIDAIVRDDLLPEEETSRIVYDSSAKVMQDVLENPRSGKNIRRAERVVRATVLSIMKNPDALWQMTGMASHDYYTYTHCVNVSMFLVAASQALLGIDGQKELEEIGTGGMLHDIGKSGVPGEILNKPGKLTDEEFERIKEHPQIGVELVADSRRLRPASRAIIRHHHESYDGSGYPDGLTADGIGRVARLAKVVDVYDALTTDRSYASARKPYAALKLMQGPLETEFDLKLLRRFVRFLGPDGFALEESKMEV